MPDTQQLAWCVKQHRPRVSGVSRQPDWMSEANLRRPTTALTCKKTLKRRNLYEFGRKFIDIRKIIFILAETTWDIVPKHY